MRSSEPIQQRGLIISAYPPNTPPIATNFPQRNRIVSGLSLAVLIVEAALKSGSLITARLANEQGRLIFALPGSTQNPLSTGCHQLIKQGAMLVDDPQDIINTIAPQLPSPSSNTKIPSTITDKHSPHQKLDRLARMLLECLGFESTSIDQLTIRSGLSLQMLTDQLLELELAGLIKNSDGRYIRLK